MKIGISFHPYGCGYARFGKMKFSKMAQHGFLNVDYNMADTETAWYAMDGLTQRQIMLEQKAEADSFGIKISQVHAPWRYPPRDAEVEDRRERMEKMKASILGARYLGCRYWVVHPIMPCGTHDLETGEAQKTWDLNLEFMTELLAFAKGHGITVCLENMPMRSFSLSKPLQILKFVETVDDENFQICLDTGHAALFSDLSVGDAVRALGNHIKVLHVHDNFGDQDSHLWPLSGVIDWTDFVRALTEIGFCGVFSLETAPSESLHDADFEAECIELYRIAETLVGQK